MAAPDQKRARGRRPGRIERTTCPVCGRDCAARADGRPFRHQPFLPNGYTRAMRQCSGGERNART